MAKAKRPVSKQLASDRPPSSRATVSGPAHPVSEPLSDDLSAKAAGTQELAAAVAFNSIKALEYDAGAASAPPVGPSVVPADPIVGAITVTEKHGSDKVGSGGPIVGSNKTIGSVDRVRSDATKRKLTTNQSVPVGGNQSSLKAGIGNEKRWEQQVEQPNTCEGDNHG